jgi:hypothetical protein
MGFALWIEGDVAWAQGTHEYRPMGTAVVGTEMVFVARDFKARWPAPPRTAPHFIGLFASLGQVNDYLTVRRSQRLRKKPLRRRRPVWPIR